MAQRNSSIRTIRPGALLSKYVTPFADLQIRIAEGWYWHGNWEHHGYNEGGPSGGVNGNVFVPGSLLPSRDFHGDVVTLSVKYAF